ncbi:glycosyltransferase family 4 protein [Rhodomicrobium vannielii ATCC 17100]|uniref:glycosyltransferase family 4 protein n=1 Tax=Rhodomicrobium vannielii TaxID=1069 RepID=UPI0019192F8C|nr:glycosyltransferase family 4 protein [Rhodomicrobium vannielii]MBJ7534521.1 glycosyltransferase family 4 protein [Rhodomicrobium vannielii ATCC 17100]
MKIAQIAPLAESCPPKLYGGTERIVSYMTEELVRQGHEVTLFASGDSQTDAELVACSEMGLRLDPNVQDPLPHQMAMLEYVRQRVDEFDVLHFHIDLLQFPMISSFADKTVTTLHGRLDLPDLLPFYTAFRNVPLSSISYHQRLPVPSCVRWAGNVYHGLPRLLLPFSPEPTGGYLAFLGRISPEKRPDRAIEIAARTGMPLKIAAKIDKVDHGYWKEKIEPMVKATPGVEYIGEINEQQKAAFLGDAAALLFPIDWPEPFGLVMIEAMACGTPVIAFRSGSVPEVIDDGVSGYVVDSIDEAVKAVSRLSDLDRSGVRGAFEERFTAERMAKNYIKMYQSLIGHTRHEIGHPRRPNGHDVGMQVRV